MFLSLEPYDQNQLLEFLLYAQEEQASKRCQEAQEALQGSEQRYRDLFESSQEAISITSADGGMIEINQAALNLLGISREQALSRNVEDTYTDPTARERFQKEISEKGFVKDYEVRLRRPDGSEIDCLLTSTVRRNSDDTVLGFQNILRDVTERKQLENQFLQTKKMEALGTLAGGIAHDFNNILTGIMGFTEVLRLRSSLDSEERNDLLQIQQLADRAARLTEQLLLSSRQKSMQKTVLNLDAVIENTLKMLQRIIGEDIDLTFDPDPKLGAILADEGQVEQVMMNLVVNARDAMPKGGKLTVQTANVRIDGEYADTEGELEPGFYVSVTVTDTGEGMDENAMQKIFDPFFTTKEVGRGTGLGLSTVHAIVKNHEGYIQVKSEPEKGTSLTVLWPRTKHVFQQADVEAKREPMPGGTETILLVEDEQQVRDLIQRALVSVGYRVLSAASPAEARMRKGKVERKQSKIFKMPFVVTWKTLESTTSPSLLRSKRNLSRSIFDEIACCLRQGIL